MIALQEMSREPGLMPVREVLTLNPQLFFDPAIWPYVAFKGGREFGVLSGVWLMERIDGRRFVFTFGLNNPDAVIDQQDVIPILDDAMDLLARTP